MSSVKWDKNSKEASFLRKKVLSGEIDPSWPPKKAYEAFPSVFSKFSLDKFRGGYNRIKSELNYNINNTGKENSLFDSDDDADNKGESKGIQ